MIQRYIGSFFILIYFGIFSGCTPYEAFDAETLVGNWTVHTWFKKDSEQRLRGKMDFKFQSNGLYEINFGPKIEQGKYWLEGEYLHTHADDKAEMKVLIEKLNSDTLAIEMNRGGSLESVVFVRPNRSSR